MRKNFLSLAILISVIFSQCNLVAYADMIQDNVVEQSFKGQNLSKPVYKYNPIEDGLVQRSFQGQKILKPEFKSEPITDEISSVDFSDAQLVKLKINSASIEDVELIRGLTGKKITKPVFKYKLIDENAEVVRVNVSSVGALSTKKLLNEGLHVNFKVVSDVEKNGQLYIKKDTPVNGIIETITGASRGGDPAELIVGDFSTTDVNGSSVDLHGEIRKKGQNRAVWIRPLAFIGPYTIYGAPLKLLLLIKGGQANIKTNQSFALYQE